MNEDDLKRMQMNRVIGQYYDELDARMPELYLDLLKRVEELERLNKDLENRLFELERKSKNESKR